MTHKKRTTCKGSYFDIFTARKRSLRRLCFYRCLSVHRGGFSIRGGSPSQGGFSIQGGSPSGGSPSGGVLHPGGFSIRGGSPSEGVLHPGGFSIWGGSPSGGFSIWGASPSGGWLSIRSMCGRYASYWNAFLFNNHFIIIGIFPRLCVELVSACQWIFVRHVPWPSHKSIRAEL